MEVQVPKPWQGQKKEKMEILREISRSDGKFSLRFPFFLFALSLCRFCIFHFHVFVPVHVWSFKMLKPAQGQKMEVQVPKP